MDGVQSMERRITRRQALRAAGHLAIGQAVASCLGTAAVLLPRGASALAVGPLLPPDANGIRLPAGFRSRVIAIGGLPVRPSAAESFDYVWHMYPDGGATFAADDGGWVYVSNSETVSELGAGASALRFAADGRLVDAYRILSDTQLNCAGGPTPWGTWLSCEEIAFGHVYECDPFGRTPAQRRRALGGFTHEAVAVDPVYRHLYLTEDESDGRLYRFVPDRYPDLSTGRLEVATVDPASNVVFWRRLPLPDPLSQPLGFLFPTRKQIPDSTVFRGGEGIWYHNGTVYFTTKGDNRVWALDTHTQVLRVLYDASTSSSPVLSGVDNVTVGPHGKVLVAEDGGDMQLAVVDANGQAAPILQVDGQSRSELTGPAFNPAGNRLYFSSQRGPFNDGQALGITYEVSGPFQQLLA
jgi:uncharacterized protein